MGAAGLPRAQAARSLCPEGLSPSPCQCFLRPPQANSGLWCGPLASGLPPGETTGVGGVNEQRALGAGLLLKA